MLLCKTRARFARCTRGALLGALALALSTSTTQAHAEAAALVFVAAQPGTRDAQDAMANVRAAFARRPDIMLLGNDVLAERLTRHGYRRRGEPSIRGESLGRDADELLQAVAFGHDDEAVARGEVLLTEHGDDVLARGASDDDARALADICLYVVRALEHRGDGGRARERARECQRMIPDLTASADLHPPEILALLAAAKSQALPAELHVQLAGRVSGCTLRVQGRPFAPNVTPASAGSQDVTLVLVPGKYVLQASCAAPGFVHAIELQPGKPLTVTIDTELEQALSVAPVGLVYAGDAALPSASATRFDVLAGWLETRTLWTATLEPGALQLAKLEARDGHQAPGGLALVSQAAVALEPRATLTPRLERALAGMTCAAGCKPTPQSKPLGAIGITTVALGAGAVVASYALLASYASLDHQLDALALDDAHYAGKLRSRDRLGTAAIIASGAGSATLATAAVLWLPASEGTPWWAWLSGGAGLIAGGVGVVSWLGHGDAAGNQAGACPSGQVCLRRSSHLPLAPMLVTQGAALLSIPLTYWVRSASRDASDELSLSAGGGQLGLDFRRRFGGL